MPSLCSKCNRPWSGPSQLRQDTRPCTDCGGRGLERKVQRCTMCRERPGEVKARNGTWSACQNCSGRRASNRNELPIGYVLGYGPGPCPTCRGNGHIVTKIYYCQGSGGNRHANTPAS